jgi:hypothetical protein
VAVVVVSMEEVSEVAVSTAVAAESAALLVAALALRQPLTVAAFEQRRPSGVHTLPGEVSAHRTSTTAALECQL